MKKSLEALEHRYNKLLNNGRNDWDSGVLRKLRSKIARAKEAAERS